MAATDSCKPLTSTSRAAPQVRLELEQMGLVASLEREAGSQVTLQLFVQALDEGLVNYLLVLNVLCWQLLRAPGQWQASGRAHCNTLTLRSLRSHSSLALSADTAPALDGTRSTPPEVRLTAVHIIMKAASAMARNLYKSTAFVSTLQE